VLYKQCRLRKGNLYLMSWIPSTLAVVGKTVGLKENGVWDSGWVVESASNAQDRDEKKIKWPPLDPRMTRI
jgi:hypothetical protein